MKRDNKNVNRKNFFHVILIVISFILFIISMRVMRYYANNLSLYVSSEKILDLRFGYSMDEVKNYLDKLGKDGRNYYSDEFHFIDTFYPVIYCAFYLLTLGYFVKNVISRRWKYSILLIPIIGIICDYGENFFINSFIKDTNNIHDSSVLMANIFTKIKFVSVYGSLLIIIILLIIYVIKKTGASHNRLWHGK
jgi:hypothetical protein